MQKLFITLILMLMLPVQYLACDACEKQQPAFTRGITHGAGPTGNADWVIVTAMIIISLVTLVLSAKHLLRPGETDKSHIKHSILR